MRRAIIKTDFEMFLGCFENGELQVDIQDPQVCFKYNDVVYVLHTFESESYGGSASVIFDGKESVTVGTSLLDFIEEADS